MVLMTKHGFSQNVHRRNLNLNHGFSHDNSSGNCSSEHNQDSVNEGSEESPAQLFRILE